MEIYKHYLTPNEWSRPQKKLHAQKALVMHWTAVPYQNEEQVWRFFENHKTGTCGYGSAHFIIGQKGGIIQCLPEDEVAYHCGSSTPDPKSGRIYTDEARAHFGKYAENPDALSPNLVTIGIELCPTDDDGTFSEKTLASAVELCAYLCRKHRLTAGDIMTHHEIVGWKDCPRLWTAQPDLADDFRQRVRAAIVKDFVV